MDAGIGVGVIMVAGIGVGVGMVAGVGVGIDRTGGDDVDGTGGVDVDVDRQIKASSILLPEVIHPPLLELYSVKDVGLNISIGV
ncbi:hypothetical protein Tco_0046407 [Tanacetum coccineum]